MGVDSLVKYGGEDVFWIKHCGFLDLDMGQFLDIQEALLREQIRLVSGSQIGNAILGGRLIRTADDFRNLVPLTTYNDYRAMFIDPASVRIAGEPQMWVQTSDIDNSFKHIPYTRYAYDKLLDNLMAVFLLSTSTDRARSTLCAGVLNKIGEDFEKSSGRRGGIASRLGDPRVMMRLARGFALSRFHKRSLRPADVWPLKSVIGWGIDTTAYRESIHRYWGASPYEFHACTEAGILAVQTWTRNGMTFVPNSNFLEFIPEDEWLRGKDDPDYQPRTLLLSDVQPGKRYELVITNFYGMPLIRYRVGHLIKVLSLSDPDAAVNLPQVAFEGRADDLVDLCGFTRLSERTMIEATVSAGMNGYPWTCFREMSDGQPLLHFYAEMDAGADPAPLAAGIHDQLCSRDIFYRDLDRMMGLHPVRITPLPPGTLARFSEYSAAHGKQNPSLVRKCLAAPQGAAAGLLAVAEGKDLPGQS